MKNDGSGLRIGVWVLSIVGLLLLAGAGFQYLNIRHKKTNWIPVDGVVTNFVVDPSKGGAAPIMIYLWEQDSLSYTSELYQSPPAFELGERVSLFVNPMKTDEVLLDTFQLYLLLVVLGSLGVIFNLVGLSILFYSKRI
jgi:hypothetical protein